MLPLLVGIRYNTYKEVLLSQLNAVVTRSTARTHRPRSPPKNTINPLGGNSNNYFVIKIAIM